MRTRRSLKLALAVVAALLAAGTTFAWAGVLVGGHRADHIGTFEPVVRRLVPATAPVAPRTATAPVAPGTATGTRPVATSTSGTSGTSGTNTSHGAVTEPATAAPPTTSRHPDDSRTPTTGDNGRSNDD